MARVKEQIECKKCPFNSGVQCHGHSEYWAECKLLVQNAKILEKYFQHEILDQVVVKNGDVWDFVINDKSTCKIFELSKYIEEVNINEKKEN